MARFLPETRTLGSWQPGSSAASLAAAIPSALGGTRNIHRGQGGNKNELGEILDAIETCGDFATKHQYSQFANPGLRVGDTLIALPLDPAQVPLIRDASRQAPFGRGDETLVDTSVRNTWELDTSKFRISNPAWSTFVANALRDVSQSLGMSGVKTELYKLLLYEEQSFFKRHKDSEKAPGMIATLSICLPSRYKGGEVHLSHTGKNHVFNTSQSLFDISALAWYSDVTHEIKPIAEGHRLVLIYNIIRTGDDGATSADFLVQQDRELHSAIAKLRLRSPAPKRTLYFLEHKYSQSSLRIDHLKGRDRAVVQSLQEPCMSNGYYLFLCNVTKRHPDGYVSDDEDEDNEDDDDYGRYSSYGYYTGGGDGPSLAIDTIATCSGQIFASDVQLKKGDILGPSAYSQRDADSESEGEWTGNEGAETEYRYHDSAVVIVPKYQLDQFLDYRADLQVLFELVMGDLKAHPEDPAIRKFLPVFLSKAVKSAPAISPLILSILPMALELKEDALFCSAVRAGFNNNIPRIEVMQSLVGIVRSITSRPVDWDKIFGEFVSNHRSLTRLSVSLDFVKRSLGPGELQTSFQQWRSTTELLSFESRKSLAIDDHDFVLELAALRWEDVDWITNMFQPKVRDCSDKKFLSKLICSLLHKDREGVLHNAKGIASMLLESELQKLQLARVKFNSQAGDPADRSEANRFIELIENCLLSGLQPSIDELLRLSCHSVETASVNDGTRLSRLSMGEQVSTLAEEMLQILCNRFEDSKMTPSKPAQDFVTAVLRKYFLRDLPRCPRQLESHRHQPRGCRQCKHCEELDAFLYSPTEKERTFLKGPKITAHLQGQLPHDLFECTKRNVPGRGKGPQCILTVTKLNLEYQSAMEEYREGLCVVLKKLRPFRTEYMKQFLGDKLYSELVMLEHLPHIKSVGPSNREVRAGLKREAEEDLETPGAKRVALLHKASFAI